MQRTEGMRDDCYKMYIKYGHIRKGYKLMWVANRRVLAIYSESVGRGYYSQGDRSACGDNCVHGNGRNGGDHGEVTVGEANHKGWAHSVHN
jgi:hypothetical protein